MQSTLFLHQASCFFVGDLAIILVKQPTYLDWRLSFKYELCFSHFFFPGRHSVTEQSIVMAASSPQRQVGRSRNCEFLWYNIITYCIFFVAYRFVKHFEHDEWIQEYDSPKYHQLFFIRLKRNFENIAACVFWTLVKWTRVADVYYCLWDIVHVDWWVLVQLL